MRESETERRRRFDALFALHSANIVSYCGWRAGSASDAQDAAADVFLTAWRRLPSSTCECPIAEGQPLQVSARA